jgi:hypothetical protein
MKSLNLPVKLPLKVLGVFVFVALNISGPDCIARSSDSLFSIQVHSTSPELAEAKAEQGPATASQNLLLEKDQGSEPENSSPADEKNENKGPDHRGMQKI